MPEIPIDVIATKLEKCGNVQFSIAEAALYCGISQSAIMESEEYTAAWLRGRVRTEAIARQHILDAAGKGDLSACRQLLQLAEQSRPELEDD